jgi:REP element-mobilizing transposase RayT
MRAGIGPCRARKVISFRDDGDVSIRVSLIAKLRRLRNLMLGARTARPHPPTRERCNFRWIDNLSRFILNADGAVRAPSKMKHVKPAVLKELQKAGWHSRGYLPHFDGGEIAQTITMRLADSLPIEVLKRWIKELSTESERGGEAIARRRVERYLDQGFENCLLRDTRIAEMVQESLLHFDGERYRLSAWAVMPNHVHLLLTPINLWPLSKIMKLFKSYTSHEANRILDRRGQFWMEDYFDRYVRNARHFTNAIRYIESNPVKAGLSEAASDWRFSSARFRQPD